MPLPALRIAPERQLPVAAAPHAPGLPPRPRSTRPWSLFPTCVQVASSRVPSSVFGPFRVHLCVL